MAYEPALTARGNAERALPVKIVSTTTQRLLLALLVVKIGAIGAAWATIGESVVALGLSAWRIFR